MMIQIIQFNLYSAIYIVFNGALILTLKNNNNSKTYLPERLRVYEFVDTNVEAGDFEEEGGDSEKGIDAGGNENLESGVQLG